ncbi:hypothetical protein B0H12DRAFT_1153038, partial [Mycena haematopus]
MVAVIIFGLKSPQNRSFSLYCVLLSQIWAESDGVSTYVFATVPRRSPPVDDTFVCHRHGCRHRLLQPKPPKAHFS